MKLDKVKKYLFALILLCSAVAVLVVRIEMANIHTQMPAGDTFNFINAGQYLAHFDYPKDERRLPFYPLLIRLFSYYFDPVTVAVFVSIISSALLIVVLYAIARALQISNFAFFILIPLAIVDPFLSILAVRPLADSLSVLLIFLCIAIVLWSKPKYLWSFVTATVFSATILTRYENIPIIILLAVYLFFIWRKEWRMIVITITISFALISPWLMLSYRVFGTPFHNAYTDSIQDTNDSWGSATMPQVITNLRTILENARFGDAWAILLHAQSNPLEDSNKYYYGLLEPRWIFSIIALIGFFWIVVSQKFVAFPVIASLILFLLTYAWWGPTFRFTAPIAPWFLLCFASGISFLLHSAYRFRNSYVKLGLSLIVILFTLYLVYLLIPGMQQTALGRVGDGAGRRMMTMNAVRVLARQGEHVGFITPVLMLNSYVGDSNWGVYAGGRAVDLSSTSNDSLENTHDLLHGKEITVLFDQGEPYMKRLVSHERSLGHIRLEQTYYPYIQGEREVKLVYLTK